MLLAKVEVLGYDINTEDDEWFIDFQVMTKNKRDVEEWLKILDLVNYSNLGVVE